MQAKDPSSRLRFGVFEVDVQTGELTRQGKRLRLQEQPFQLLVMLLERPGVLVTRQELSTRLWPQTVVDFDHGLNKAVGKIREILGDSPENPRFIETVARRGYRFLADVTVVTGGEARSAGEPIAPPGTSELVGSAHAGKSSRMRPGSAMLFGLGTALVLAASIAWMLFPRSLPAPAIRSLAVLPMENISGDTSQDYFADGMTDELITRLAQVSALRVISRTSVMSYKGARNSLPEIARALNVDAIVEGTVSRSGERVRINAQLIQASTGTYIWAHSYDEELQDALALQSKVARDIAEQIRVTLNPQEQAALVKSRPVNPDAYEAYLKGRYFWNKRTADGLKKAIEYFNHAIEADPAYAEAYSGLADSYALSGDWEYGVLPPRDAFARAGAAAKQALALDPSLAEAHTSLAFALDLYGWGWQAAEEEYRLAIKLNPGYATAHHWYAWHLIVMGQIGEGILELRKAESLDPLSLIIKADIADALCIAHRYDEAVQESGKTLEMDQGFAVAHYELGQALAQKRMYDEAIAAFQKAIELSGHNGAFDSNLGYVYAVSGRRDEATRIIRSLEKRQDQNPSADANVALIYVALGDADQAMSWLNKAYEARFNPSILLRPGFDPLRSDTRFQDLMRRIGLPPQPKNSPSP
jgi:TolB-like protein/DNA-binding winged helix-turn-helix (wHTH) protein/Flp pilus assembly protein TadD